MARTVIRAAGRALTRTDQKGRGTRNVPRDETTLALIKEGWVCKSRRLA
jgi:hypothetical protein